MLFTDFRHLSDAPRVPRLKQVSHTRLCQRLAQLAAARRREEELLNELSELKLKYNTAAETSRQHFLEFQLQSTKKASLENAAAQAKARLQESQIECAKGSAALRKAETRLQYYMKQGDKKKLKRREEKLAEKVAELKLATQLAETRRTERKKKNSVENCMSCRSALMMWNAAWS